MGWDQTNVIGGSVGDCLLGFLRWVEKREGVDDKR